MKQPIWQPLPFAPEPTETLKARFNWVLEHEINPAEMLCGVQGQDLPLTVQRQHVFDFQEGVRMVATREHLANDEHYLHFSFSAVQGEAIGWNPGRLVLWMARTTTSFVPGLGPPVFTKGSRASTQFWCVYNKP